MGVFFFSIPFDSTMFHLFITKFLILTDNVPYKNVLSTCTWIDLWFMLKAVILWKVCLLGQTHVKTNAKTPIYNNINNNSTSTSASQIWKKKKENMKAEEKKINNVTVKEGERWRNFYRSWKIKYALNLINVSYISKLNKANALQHFVLWNQIFTPIMYVVFFLPLPFFLAAFLFGWSSFSLFSIQLVAVFLLSFNFHKISIAQTCQQHVLRKILKKLSGIRENVLLR